MKIKKYYLGSIYALLSFFTVSTFDIKVGPNAGIITILLKSYIPKMLFASLVVTAIYSFTERRKRSDLYLSIILGVISIVLTETYFVLKNFQSLQWLTTIPTGSTGGMRMPTYAIHVIPLLIIPIIIFYRRQAVKMLLILSIVFVVTYLFLHVRFNGIRLNRILWVEIELFTFFLSLPIVINKITSKKVSS